MRVGVGRLPHFFLPVFLSSFFTRSRLFFLASISLKRSKSDIALRAFLFASFFAQADAAHFFKTSSFASAFFSVFSRAPFRMLHLKSVRERRCTGIWCRGTPVRASGPSTTRRLWDTISMMVQTLPSQGPKVMRALAKDEVLKKWAASAWAKKLANKKARSAMSDFDRFKLMLAKKKRRDLVKKELKKTGKKK